MYGVLGTHEHGCIFRRDLYFFTTVIFFGCMGSADYFLHHFVSFMRGALELSTRSQVTFWKQRGKFRGVCEGDENTRFFHAMASHRYRRNQIHSLDVDGAIIAAHMGKADALHSFYLKLLGRARPTRWAFDMDALDEGAPAVNGPRLVAPFFEAEVRAVVDGARPHQCPRAGRPRPKFLPCGLGDGGGRCDAPPARLPCR